MPWSSSFCTISSKAVLAKIKEEPISFENDRRASYSLLCRLCVLHSYGAIIISVSTCWSWLHSRSRWWVVQLTSSFYSEKEEEEDETKKTENFRLLNKVAQVRFCYRRQLWQVCNKRRRRADVKADEKVRKTVAYDTITPAHHVGKTNGWARAIKSLKI